MTRNSTKESYLKCIRSNLFNEQSNLHWKVWTKKFHIKPQIFSGFLQVFFSGFWGYSFSWQQRWFVLVCSDWACDVGEHEGQDRRPQAYSGSTHGQGIQELSLSISLFVSLVITSIAYFMPWTFFCMKRTVTPSLQAFSLFIDKHPLLSYSFSFLFLIQKQINNLT